MHGLKSCFLTNICEAYTAPKIVYCFRARYMNMCTDHPHKYSLNRALNMDRSRGSRTFNVNLYTQSGY